MATPAAAAAAPEPSRLARLTAWLRGSRERVPFPDLVWSHYRRQQLVLQASSDPSLAASAAEASRAYEEQLRRFEACEGPIVSAYWCVHLPSGVALTARPPRRLLRPLDWVGWPRRLAFHRASDWSTQPAPRAAALLHRCDALAVRIGEVLIGTGHQIAMGLVGRSGGNLLSLVDSPSGPQSVEALEEALDREERRLKATEQYYRQTAVRQSQLVYIFGMFLGAVALVGTVLAVLWTLDRFTGVSWGLKPGVTLSLTELLGVATAGALGAIVSVVRRVDASSFAIDYEVGRLCLTGLGMLRPFMGAVFGVALYAAIISGLLDLFKLPTAATPQFFFLLTIAFVAGFSERFAADTLLASTDRSGADAAPAVPPPPGGGSGDG